MIPNMEGACYVVSEAVYHLLGGATSGFKPHRIVHEGIAHWYLRHTDTGVVIDLTANQFETPVDYSKGRGRGFLSREPSKRARALLIAMAAA